MTKSISYWAEDLLLGKLHDKIIIIIIIIIIIDYDKLLATAS